MRCFLCKLLVEPDIDAFEWLDYEHVIHDGCIGLEFENMSRHSCPLCGIIWYCESRSCSYNAHDYCPDCLVRGLERIIDFQTEFK